nr:probable methyltransferase PMT5 [Tanacetum cinerariifolium]
QLSFPSLTYDMVHSVEFGILWDDKDGLLLIEVDRILKPGGQPYCRSLEMMLPS